MNSDASHLTSRDLDLSDMQAGTDVDTELLGLRSDRACASDGLRGHIEDGKHPVTSGIDLAPAEPLQVTPEDP